jgi:hypothetical protein
MICICIILTVRRAIRRAGISLRLYDGGVEYTFCTLPANDDSVVPNFVAERLALYYCYTQNAYVGWEL